MKIENRSFNKESRPISSFKIGNCLKLITTDNKDCYYLYTSKGVANLGSGFLRALLSEDLFILVDAIVVVS